MTLPSITLPIQVPEAVPLLLHPAIVHFAIVLPLVILFIELINLFTKRKALSISIYALFVLLMVIYVAAYITGVTDGREAGALLNDEGAADLKSHKLLGTYLIYFALLPIILKIVSFFVDKGWSRALYSLALILLIALTFYQGNKGGKLVYKHGANVASQQALEERLEELTFELEDYKELLADSNEDNVSAADTNVTVHDSNATLAGATDIENNGTKAASTENNVTTVRVKNDDNSIKKSDINSSK